MARGSRWRRGARAPAVLPESDNVDLSAPEHAWWAEPDLHAERPPRLEPTAPPPEPISPPPEPARDVLAEHLGEDWRTSFGLDHPGVLLPPQVARDPDPTPAARPDPEPEPEPEPSIDVSDAYAVLGVDPTATWDEIIDAHRTLAWRHHPDRLVGRPSTELQHAEHRIREINIAYQELRVRRGR